jgi:mycothiol synthase
VSATWSLVDRLDGPARDGVGALMARVESETGDEAFSEDGLERIASGDLRHALRRDHGVVTGYGIASNTTPIEAEPMLGSFDDGFARLLESAGGEVALLLRNVADESFAGLGARGWALTRRVDRLCRPLPAATPEPTSLVVRAFEPDHDEAVWVEQNNAAFVGHPTQGTMTVEKLVAREAAPWFWTKVHHGASRDVGEIYVVSVAPFAQGRGLGRVAVLAGLAHLADRGVGLAELYVEEDNVAAYSLYESLGFTYDARVVELRRGSNEDGG